MDKLRELLSKMEDTSINHWTVLKFYVFLPIVLIIATSLLIDVDVYSSLFGFILSLISFMTYFLYLIPRQIYAAKYGSDDGLNELRWIIFWLLLLALVTAAPPLLYQYIRFNGDDSEFIRSISTICSNISKYVQTVGYVLIFTYRRKL